MSLPVPVRPGVYCSPQLTATRTTFSWLAGAAVGARLLPPQAASPAAAAALATMITMRFETCSVRCVAPDQCE